MKNLSQSKAQQLIEHMMSGSMSHQDIVDTLRALAEKGEHADEIVGAVRAMRSRMMQISAPLESIDTCGTGGDGKHTFNISTTVALVVAGTGVPVVKHGNRKASSLCGSADVLEELGVKIALTPLQAKNILSKVGTVFLYAPIYHPTMKYVARARQELGTRTIFNLLGPFTNPAKVTRQIIGVPNPEILEILTKVAKNLDYKYLALVTSEDGLDEISPVAKSKIKIIHGSRESSIEVNPNQYGMHHTSLEKIIGGDAKKNSRIILSVLNGKKGLARDVVLLNAAMAILVSGRANSFDQGLYIAKRSIDSGAAQKILESFILESNKV